MATPQPEFQPASSRTVGAGMRQRMSPPSGAVALQVGACRVDLKSRDLRIAFPALRAHSTCAGATQVGSVAIDLTVGGGAIMAPLLRVCPRAPRLRTNA